MYFWAGFLLYLVLSLNCTSIFLVHIHYEPYRQFEQATRCCPLLLFVLGRRKFIVHCFQQPTQKLLVLHIIHKEHFLCAFIRQFRIRIRHHCHSGLCGLYKEALIVNTADHLAAIVDDVFSHHRPIGYIVQFRQLL